MEKQLMKFVSNLSGDTSLVIARTQRLLRSDTFNLNFQLELSFLQRFFSNVLDHVTRELEEISSEKLFYVSRDEFFKKIPTLPKPQIFLNSSTEMHLEAQHPNLNDTFQVENRKRRVEDEILQSTPVKKHSFKSQPNFQVEDLSFNLDQEMLDAHSSLQLESSRSVDVSRLMQDPKDSMIGDYFFKSLETEKKEAQDFEKFLENLEQS
eukprot:TRINITY_DN500_c6_g1_i1.p1 TRINITY_DN500_c6_g1~~TRINITY_DN500_c6_g1_i1.p1  ORF type:complete len:224 (+),score=112.19 TRINITY_DN500_c6_g1_i1:50-673(+)